MGDIEDEYDEIEEPQLKKLDEHTYLIDGFMNVDDLNEELSLDLESEDHDTISGFLLDLLGKILEDGSKTSVDYKNLHFDILEVEDKHIEKIRLIIQPEEKTEE